MNTQNRGIPIPRPTINPKLSEKNSEKHFKNIKLLDSLFLAQNDI